MLAVRLMPSPNLFPSISLMDNPHHIHAHTPRLQQTSSVALFEESERRIANGVEGRMSAISNCGSEYGVCVQKEACWWKLERF
jgi:hypothetical protein